MRSGDAAITLRLESDPQPISRGPHRLHFRNDNETEGSVYLANALVPESDRIAVTGQRRDVDQRELTVELNVGAARPSNTAWAWLLMACAVFGERVVRRRKSRSSTVQTLLHKR